MKSKLLLLPSTLLLACLSLSVTVSSRCRAETWSLQPVRESMVIGPQTGRILVLDAADRPHVIYGGRHLYHAWREGDYWSTEVVDAGEGTGGDASLVLDADGSPHISYRDEARNALKHAWRDAGGWHTEEVEAGPGIGRYTSLGIDADGNVHVSYYDSDNGDLKYARKDAGGWQTEVVDADGDTGLFTSLALDTAGMPHLVYRAATGELRYAWRDGSGWHLETAGSSAWGAPGNTSLALDAAGRPHVAFLGKGKLWYGRRDGGEWQTDYVNEAREVCQPSLFLGPDGSPVIGFCKYGGSKYAVPPEGGPFIDSNAWQTRRVGSGGDVGLALDGQGRPCVVTSSPGFSVTYHVRVADEVKRSWDRTTLVQAGIAGGLPSLALDTEGRPRVACLSADRGDYNYIKRVIYAAAGPDGWRIENVSQGRHVRGLSLAVGRGGRPHLAYTTERRVHYATRDGKGWQTKVVDDGLDSPGTPALAVSPSGRPAIAFADGGRLLYGVTAGAGWRFETVGRASARKPVSLLFDRRGRPRLFFGRQDTVTYARRTPSGWVLGTVDAAAGGLGNAISPALDHEGRPILAYETAEGLKFAWRDGEGWHLEIVDPLGHGGSLAVGPDGRPWVAYLVGSQLARAFRDEAGWHIEAVEGIGEVDTAPSLAVDPSGDPLVAAGDDGGLWIGRRSMTGSGTIGGSVFHDLDGDGSRGGNEPGLADVRVSLSREGFARDAVTGADGSYLLAGLEAGTYLLEVDPTDRNLPSGASLTAGENPLTVALAEGEAFAGADFGFRGAASGPDLRVNRRGYRFGPTPVGGDYREEVLPTFRLANLGDQPLTLEKLRLRGLDASEFVLQDDLCSGRMLLPSATCELRVTFVPDSFGNKEAVLVVRSNDPDGARRLTLAGSEYERVILLEPDGGEIVNNWFRGGGLMVRWGAPGHAVAFRLYYSRTGTGDWRSVTSSAIQGDRYGWDFPDSFGRDGREPMYLKVVGYDEQGRVVGEDILDHPFFVHYDDYDP